MRILLVALTVALPLLSYAQTPAPTPKAVLVTGASTGIGHEITKRLASAGYFVYAGARKDADLAALNAIKNVQAIRLDVTRQQDIEAAVATITKAGRGLHGLVNNAGVASVGPLATMNMEEIDLTLQRSSGEAIIRVRDHGLGIPTVYRDRVVEKFFRVPSPETAGIPGAGLGLTLVDHIVRGHGGRLEIESLVGSGSTFSIHLPVGQPS